MKKSTGGGHTVLDKRAFTLIELLAIIVILAVIALIATPIVLNIIENTKQSSILRSAELYVHGVEMDIINEQLSSVQKEDRQYSVEEFSNVKFDGQVPSAGMIDLIDGKIIDYSLQIGDYIVNYDETKRKPVIGGELRKAEFKPIVEIIEGMTPVQYINNNWIVVDGTKKNWYNYSTQEWANAVILNSGVSKNIGDTVDVSSEVKGMFVYIPRYEYKIEGTYGKGGTSTTSPGEIEVNFIGKDTTTASSGYRVHPAFTFGNEELNGIWIGKFETSAAKTSNCYTSASTTNCDNANQDPYIIPNVSSLRYQNVSNQFTTSQKLNSYITNGDSHMMKNSEWGAVAYLSQSKYGKYGNSMYTGTNKEIYQNKDSEYITGHSNGTPGQSTTNTQCTYDTLTDRGSGTGSCGGGASTTGNISGVYDMSGGTWEYVMGYLTTASSTWGATSSSNYAGFTSEPNSKYYDAYTTNTVTTACNGGICYGQALGETRGWYEDTTSFVSSSTPWLIRGGFYGIHANTGVFGFYYNDGYPGNYNSFRVVVSPTTN